MEDKQGFSYTYSAAQQQEIQHIRSKYLPKEETKLEQLRRLHRATGQKARAQAITLGTVGALILGTGMSLVMTDIGTVLGAFQAYSTLTGIVLGLLGLVLVALAYPVYNRVLQKERQRIAPLVLQLTDELMQ